MYCVFHHIPVQEVTLDVIVTYPPQVSLRQHKSSCQSPAEKTWHNDQMIFLKAIWWWSNGFLDNHLFKEGYIVYTVYIQFLIDCYILFEGEEMGSPMGIPIAPNFRLLLRSRSQKLAVPEIIIWDLKSLSSEIWDLKSEIIWDLGPRSWPSLNEIIIYVTIVGCGRSSILWCICQPLKLLSKLF